jgi:hypothetical protein
VGNLLLTVLVPLWMFWPLALPLVFGSRALYIPALLLCVRLFFTGYKIVDRNWGDKVSFYYFFFIIYFLFFLFYFSSHFLFYFGQNRKNNSTSTS